MKASLIVTTYNRPDALARVLESVRQQTRLPDETIIVDDGSDGRTAAAVSLRRAALPRLVHLWQENEGFRVSRMRNLGVAEATGEYIIFVDGDMLLHRSFVADHLERAARGSYIQGVRIDLNAAATDAYLQRPFAIRPRHLAKLSKAKSLLRSRLLSRALTGPPHTRLTRIHSCNQSFWRSDLLAVNGFDERYHGYGGEDIDLCSRLNMLGVRQLRLRNMALAYHLHHSQGTNWRQYMKLDHDSPRATIGLDQHLKRARLRLRMAA